MNNRSNLNKWLQPSDQLMLKCYFLMTIPIWPPTKWRTKATSMCFHLTYCNYNWKFHRFRHRKGEKRDPASTDNKFIKFYVLITLISCSGIKLSYITCESIHELFSSFVQILPLKITQNFKCEVLKERSTS